MDNLQEVEELIRQHLISIKNLLKIYDPECRYFTILHENEIFHCWIWTLDEYSMGGRKDDERVGS